MALTDLKIRNAKPKDKQYKLPDDDGLYLLIMKNGLKKWRFRYYFQRKEHLLSLGEYPTVSIYEARKQRDEYRQVLQRGENPIEKRKESTTITFKVIAKEWCTNQLKWSDDHRKRVMRSLNNYLFNLIGDREINSLIPQELLKLIKTIEASGKLNLLPGYYKD